MDMPDQHRFTISHLCDATLDSVWRTWSEVEHLQQWFGPREATVSQARLDFKPGGLFHYHMSMPDGQERWCKWQYIEIMPKGELVARVSFSDASGNTARHPLIETWPLELLSVVEFREQGDKTMVVVEWSPQHANEEETATFDTMHTDMTMCWRGSFDRLDEYLTQLKQG